METFYVLILDLDTDAVLSETKFVSQGDAFEHARYMLDGQVTDAYVMVQKQQDSAKRAIIDRSEWL